MTRNAPQNVASHEAQRTEITPAVDIWIGTKEAVFEYYTHLFYFSSDIEGGRIAKMKQPYRGNYKSKRQRPGGRATLDVWADQEPLMTQRPRLRKAENGSETRETGGGLMTNAPIGRMDLF